MEPIITSLLDLDQYKISMMYFVWKNAPEAIVKYKFVCRNKDVKLGFLRDSVRDEIISLIDLKFTDEDINYLKKLRYLSNNFTDYSFFDFLKDYKMCNANTKIDLWDDNGDLAIEISGKWIDTILFEVPILAIVNELFFRSIDVDKDKRINDGLKRLDLKLELIKNRNDFSFSEFGTRRRFSKEWQDIVMARIIQTCPNNLIGTSNIFLAKKYNILPVGTFGHELPMGFLGISPRIENAQRDVLYKWMAQFWTSDRMDIGIALSDTFTSDAFFRDFKYPLASIYSGVRQDSGDPFIFGEKTIDHYKKLGIDPKTKTIIFSDNLNFPLSLELCDSFSKRIKVSFGIGTNITNDCLYSSINIVMKLIECNGIPCVKLSDNYGKVIGNNEMVMKVREAYHC